MVLTVRIKGGLGNQLFQYAAAYAFSQNHKQELKLDTSFYPNQTLRGYKLASLAIDTDLVETGENLSNSVRLIKQKHINKAMRLLNVRLFKLSKKARYMLETRSELVPEFFFLEDVYDVYMDGYYQSEKYFADYREDLIRQFQPIYAPEKEYTDNLEEVRNCCSVAVHVRRGDFLKAQHKSNPRHYLLGEEYYRNALAYAEEELDNPIFYWFSDDIEWVKSVFGSRPDFRFISLNTKHTDIDELLLMSKCKNIITANSTFSWWAAWLNLNNDAMILVPAKRYGNAQMIPDRWTKISID